MADTEQPPSSPQPEARQSIESTRTELEPITYEEMMEGTTLTIKNFRDHTDPNCWYDDIDITRGPSDRALTTYFAKHIQLASILDLRGPSFVRMARDDMEGWSSH